MVLLLILVIISFLDTDIVPEAKEAGKDSLRGVGWATEEEKVIPMRVEEAVKEKSAHLQQ